MADVFRLNLGHGESLSERFSQEQLGAIDEEWRARCGEDDLASRGDPPASSAIVTSFSAFVEDSAPGVLTDVRADAVSLVTETASTAEIMRQIMILGDTFVDHVSTFDDVVAIGRAVAHSMDATAGALVHRAENMAKIDILTGLGGRRAYEIDVTGALKRVSAGFGTVTLVNFDVNGLRVVNNSYGHNAGNSYLKHFAVMLTEMVSPHDARVFHVSGDEFIALFRDMEFTSVRAACLELHELDTCPPMSYGLAEAPAETVVQRELEDLADKRMQEMKFADDDDARFAMTERWLASEHWLRAQSL